MDVQQSIEITAPPERVWPLLVEPDNVLKWYGTLTTFRYADGGPPGPGARVYAEEKGGPGMLMKLNFGVSEWVENRAVGLHMVSGTGVKAYDQRWVLEPSTEGSRFTFSEHVELPYGAVGRLIDGMVKRTSENHLKEMLAKLKELAEAA
jgi:uncharacterized protein YndB with AHSA1/START domain